MLIVNFGHFTSITPDSRIVYYENEDRLDWYEMRKALTSWERAGGRFINAVFGAWATVDPDGVVIHVEYDPSRLVPDNKTILGIDANYEDIAKGMIWNGTELLPPTPESLEKVGPPLSEGGG